MHRGPTTVIVGGGIVGSCTAYFLVARAGFRGRVLVVERDRTYARSAPCLSAASIRQQFSTAVNVRISQFGIEFLRDAARRLATREGAPDVGLHESTYLYLATSAGEAALRGATALQRSLDVPVSLLAPSELAARFPWLATDDVACGAVTESGEGWFDSHALLWAVRRKAVELGAQYVDAHVADLLVRDGVARGVRLEDGTEIAADTVVCAAGTRTAALLAAHGIDVPVRPRKRTVFHFASPAMLERGPLLVDPAGFWMRPEGLGYLCGATPRPDPDVDPDDFEPDATSFESDLWPGLAARVPGFEQARVKRSWVGHYDYNTFDQNAFVGRVPGIEHLFFACGFSGHGLQQGPAIGRGLAELVTEGEYRCLDLRALGYARYLRGVPLVEACVI